MKFFGFIFLFCCLVFACLKEESLTQQQKVDLFLETFSSKIDAREGITEGWFSRDPFVCQTNNYKPFETWIQDYPQGYNSHVDSFYVRARGYTYNSLITNPQYFDVEWFEEGEMETIIDTEYLHLWEYRSGTYGHPCTGSYGIYPFDHPTLPDGGLSYSGSLDRLHYGRNSLVISVYDPSIDSLAYYAEYWVKR